MSIPSRPFHKETKIGKPPMIRKETLYQATIVNEMRDSLAFLAKGLQNFLDFRSVFPMFRLFNRSA